MVSQPQPVAELQTEVDFWLKQLMRLAPAVRREIGERLIDSTPEHLSPAVDEELIEKYIHDRGRGPEINGTRVTIYDVMDYYTVGWRYDHIAGTLGLPPDWVQAAIAYIEQNKEQVLRDYQEIIERHRNYEYLPDVKEKLEYSRRNFERRLAEAQSSSVAGGRNAGDSGR